MLELRANVSLSNASSTHTRKSFFSFSTRVFREIQVNREQTTESMNQVKATLAAFQEEFQNRLKALGDDIHR